MELEPTPPAAKAPAERFTGDVYVDIFHTPQEPSRLGSLARTNWHRAAPS